MCCREQFNTPEGKETRVKDSFKKENPQKERSWGVWWVIHPHALLKNGL